MLFGKNKRTKDAEYKVILAGNPNVGKSTLYNTLTGMHAHTGNWAGKTVGCESAVARHGAHTFSFIDIPGTYSLLSHSEEERIARSHVVFDAEGTVIAVCDATALMQNLNLLLQITEVGRRTVLLLNFCDEAERRGILIDTAALSRSLGIPVVRASARRRRSLAPLLEELVAPADAHPTAPTVPTYGVHIEAALSLVCGGLSAVSSIAEKGRGPRFLRWVALTLLEGDPVLCDEVYGYLDPSDEERVHIYDAVHSGAQYLFSHGVDPDSFREERVSATVSLAEQIYLDCAHTVDAPPSATDRLDRLLVGRFTAYPFMLLCLGLTLFITLCLANYPSALLSILFSHLEGSLCSFFTYIRIPSVVTEALVGGVFGTVGRVVSVMLPPMAIFFPLFSILEDSGYLPRVAYNLDRPFACVGACGKQALTMCMGLGCNAVGIVGCRIIDSPRERTLAVLTNSLIPCNGRLPMLMTLISTLLFLHTGAAPTPLIALLLCGFIILGILMTFPVTYLLSRTLLRGAPSSFTIELPPYRRPEILRTVYRSLTDRVREVLLRALAVSAPLGLLIFIMAGVSVGDGSLLSLLSGALDPFARVFGMDGAIILAFLIGIPANEIVIPLLIMIYTGGGAMGAEMGADALGAFLLGVGWSPVTALCTAVFALFHFPCSTSLITVYRETHSLRTAALAFAIPTALGLLFSFIINTLFSLFI